MSDARNSSTLQSRERANLASDGTVGFIPAERNGFRPPRRLCAASASGRLTGLRFSRVATGSGMSRSFSCGPGSLKYRFSQFDG